MRWNAALLLVRFACVGTTTNRPVVPALIAKAKMNATAPASAAIIKSDRPLALRTLPDILAFALSLSAAYYLEWNTKDLVWSLWLCSFVLGYLTLLSALSAGAYIGLHAITHPDFKKNMVVPAAVGGVAVGLFFLGFFSLHFGGFHAGHSVFLNEFFPVEGMPDDGFGEAFMNPPLLWMLVFEHLMAPYGLFLIPALMAERQYVFRPLIRALAAVRTGGAPAVADNGTPGKGRKNQAIGDAMTRPYINVMRMHVLIFFFALSHALSIDSFVVYAVVYFVYFFPWSELKKLWVKDEPSPDAVQFGGGR